MGKAIGTLGLAALLAVFGCSGADSTGPSGRSSSPADTNRKPAGAAAGAITPENTKIEFIATKNDGQGENKHDGGFKKVMGTAIPIDGDITKATINVAIDTASLWTNADPKLGDHLKGPDFFDVAKFPNATFKSKEIKEEKKDDTTHVISGELTLHGVTKPVTIPAKITTTDDSVTIDGKFTIDRREFDIGKKFEAPKVNNDVTIKVLAKVSRK